MVSMPKLWVDGADRWNTRGMRFSPMSRVGSTRKMVWHKTEGDGLYEAARWMDVDGGNYYHLAIDWESGQMLQFCGADRAARSLENGGFGPGGIGCNKFGEICLQVAVVGYSKDGMIPKGSKRKNLDKVLAWADSWGVPREMPHGNLGKVDRDGGVWARESGHFSHAQAPGNRHFDPGACSPKDLFGDDEMPEYAEFGRKAFTIPAGKSVWVNWTGATRPAEPIHRRGEANLRVPGLYEATLEVRKSPGTVQVSFCEVQDREVLSADTEVVSEALALVSNKAKLNNQRNLRIRMKNVSEEPVRVFSTELRLAWWK